GRDPEFALGLQAFFANHGKMQGLARDFSPSGRPIRDSDEGLAAAASVLLSDTIPSEDVPTLEPTQIGSTAETPGLAGTGSPHFSDHLLLDEIAHGGMGVVFRGRDTGIGREVAVKVLLEEHEGDSELRHRFVDEAQIAGQLQHPGVTPVYEMGHLPDQRPY